MTSDSSFVCLRRGFGIQLVQVQADKLPIVRVDVPGCAVDVLARVGNVRNGVREIKSDAVKPAGATSSATFSAVDWP